MRTHYFATARDSGSWAGWVATSARGSFAVALDYARQRAKVYGRAEVWCYDVEGYNPPGPARLVFTVYARPRK